MFINRGNIEVEEKDKKKTSSREKRVSMVYYGGYGAEGWTYMTMKYD